MSERHERSESKDANVAARVLVERIKAGGELDSQTFAELVDVLRGYQSGTYAQLVTRPAASKIDGRSVSASAGSIKRMATSPPPVPSRGERYTKTEGFLERAPWNMFRSEVAKREFAILSDKERDSVVQGADILKNEIIAYRMLSVKAIGAKVRQYSHDYGGKDVVSPSDPSFSWEAWEKYLAQKLSPQEKSLISARPYERNVLFASTAHGFRERNLAFVSLHLWTPQNTSPTDNRGISHNAVMFLKNDRFMYFLKTGRGLRLLPFIIKVAIMQLNSNDEVFFDGSFAGEHAPFGQAPNPIATIVQNANASWAFLDTDTRTNHPSEVLFSGSDGKDFLAAALVARGRAEDAGANTIRLRPYANLPQDLPRL